MYKRLILSIGLFFLLNSNTPVKACGANPSAIPQILATMCHMCIFPLSVSGIQLMQGNMPDPSHMVGSPVCICTDPFPRVGIPVGYFEPSRLIDVVSDPYCFPTLGVNGGTPSALSGSRSGGQGTGTTSKKTFMQVHYLIFPAYAMMEIATDFICMDTGGVDAAYISEVDPTWQDDTLAAFQQPDALLFGNPISNLACIADSTASAFFSPLDPLFWCMGSWGNAYPLTGSKPTSDSYMQDVAGIAAKAIYKLHRDLILWGTFGQAGLCGRYPMPIWIKTAYRLQPVIPVPNPIATVIGQSGLLWDWGKNPPMTFDNFGFMLFKRRECCAF